MLAVWKHVGLQRQKRAARVNQVDTGKAVLKGDVLRPQMLLDADGVVGAALDRRIVRNDDHLAAGDAGDGGNQARSGRLVVVHVPGGQRRELEQRRARIDQTFDSLADRELPLLPVPLKGAHSTPLARGCHPRPQLLHEPRHARVVLDELGIGRSDVGIEAVHRRVWAGARGHRRFVSV
jgi:hypothetical protein